MSELSKKVCKKCVNERAMQQEMCWRRWCGKDDYWWKRGWINCGREKFGLIGTAKIPDCCLYELEHTVLSEKPK